MIQLRAPLLAYFALPILLTREQCSEVHIREFHSGLSICEHVSSLFPREPFSGLSTHHGISTVHHHNDADHRHHPFRFFTPRLTSSLGIFLAVLRALHPSPRRAATVHFSTYILYLHILFAEKSLCFSPHQKFHLIILQTKTSPLHQ